MKNEDLQKFVNSLSPMNPILGNRKVGGVAFNGQLYDGYILNTYSSEEQLQELSIMFLKSQLITRGPHSVDHVFIDELSTAGNQRVMNSTKENNLVARYLIMQTNTVIPNLDNLIEWNDKAQTIYPEKGTYGLLGLKSKEDANRLEYTLEAADRSVLYGYDRYPTIATKAAFLWERIAGTQAFRNGNKRTAMLAMLLTLHSNGYDFIFHPGVKQELVDFSLDIATKKVDLEQIKDYIIKNCKLNLNNEPWDTVQKLQHEQVNPDNWEEK